MDNGGWKKFAVIGNMNAITYKEVFPLIKSNRIWLGATNFNVGMYFSSLKDLYIKIRISFSVKWMEELLIEFQEYAGTRVSSMVVVMSRSL